MLQTDTDRAIMIVVSWEGASRSFHAGLEDSLFDSVTDMQLSRRHVSTMEVSSCNSQRVWRRFAKSDENSLRTWLCAAVLPSRKRGHAGVLSFRDVVLLILSISLEVGDVGLRWVLIGHIFHPHDVFCFSAP